MLILFHTFGCPPGRLFIIVSYFWAAGALGGRGTDLAQAQAAKPGPGPSRARPQAGPRPRTGAI